MAEGLFFLNGYDVRLSDVIAFAALIISGISASSAVRSSRAARRSAAISAQNLEREQTKEAKRREVRIQTFVHNDDDDGPGPQRHLKLQLRAPENGDYCELNECELVHPTSAVLEVRHSDKIASSRTADGARNTSVQLRPPIILNDNAATVGITFHLLNFDKKPTVLKFHGVRLDANRTPISATVVTPAFARGG